MAINKPFFVPQKEINLIDSMNEELIDEIIGQTVDIYKVSPENTETNIYGEAEDGNKYFDTGFRVNCLILYPDTEIIHDEFGSDATRSIEMYFHRNTLKEANFYPEIGDIVDWNNHFFEMNTVFGAQLIAGHQNFKHQIKTVAHRVRLSSINIEERPR